jgi:ATP-binding cassette subfamily F protein 2
LADWDGGLVLVSHDFRLISQVAQEIWVVADGTVKKWEGTIESYKKYLKQSHNALAKKEMVER